MTHFCETLREPSFVLADQLQNITLNLSVGNQWVLRVLLAVGNHEQLSVLLHNNALACRAQLKGEIVRGETHAAAVLDAQLPVIHDDQGLTVQKLSDCVVVGLNPFEA